MTTHALVAAAVLTALLALAGPAQAQFSSVPSRTPIGDAGPRASDADVEQEYRIDAARHIYGAYPMRVYRGKMPPMLYSIMVVETELDARGNVLNVSVVRKPAADEVAPWVMAMIKRAGPFPPPTKFGASLITRETWFVDRSGLFQLMTLTEGQR